MADGGGGVGGTRARSAGRPPGAASPGGPPALSPLTPASRWRHFRGCVGGTWVGGSGDGGRGAGEGGQSRLVVGWCVGHDVSQVGVDALGVEFHGPGVVNHGLRGIANLLVGVTQHEVDHGLPWCQLDKTFQLGDRVLQGDVNIISC